MIKPLLETGFKKQTNDTYMLPLNESMKILVWIKPAGNAARYSVFLEDYEGIKIYLEGIRELKQIIQLINTFKPCSRKKTKNK